MNTAVSALVLLQLGAVVARYEYSPPTARRQHTPIDPAAVKVVHLIQSNHLVSVKIENCMQHVGRARPVAHLRHMFPSWCAILNYTSLCADQYLTGHWV